MKIVPILKIVTISSVMRLMRNTSPKSGCIHLMVQVFFGTIIVTSFVMILLMTLKGVHNHSEDTLRCSVNKCRILCKDVDFYKEEEIHVTIAASEAVTDCTTVTLTMIRPIFKEGLFPENWLATVRANVRELSIVEGNLNHISPRSFMDPVSNNIQILIFDRIKILTWREDTFLGLSNLRELYMLDCTFEHIKENALQTVDDTLKLLDIKAVHFWNPANITGSSNLSKLEKVNFAFNIFYNALNNASFLSLQACKVLYLNSCKISFIGNGTFDPLENLEVLYLNDNSLVTIPAGLFDKLLTSEVVRIALHKNFWLCSCTKNDLRSLHNKNVIIVEPICFYPDVKNGLTFSELEKYCDSNKSLNQPRKALHGFKQSNSDSCRSMSISTITKKSPACYKDNLSFNDDSKIAHPKYHTCLSNRIKENVFYEIYHSRRNVTNSSKGDIAVKWLKPVYSSQYMQNLMIELAVTGASGDGILWYESNHKYEVYCLNAIPDILQVFSTEIEEEYTFCLFDVTSGEIHSDKCVSYKLNEFERESSRKISIIINFLIYICVAFGCLLCGATCVFFIINRNPTLLKRNKRILLVKHKTIDALILPPEVPLRKDVSENTDKIDMSNEKEKIFVLPHKDFLTQNYGRSNSMRSSESNDVSYISALSPTEEELHEWRSNKTVKDRIPTSDGDVSPLSSLYESLPYYSLQEKVYETIK